MKAYLVNFGRLSCLFPRSRSFADVLDAKNHVNFLIQRRKLYDVDSVEIVIMEPIGYGGTIVSLYKNGEWTDLP